MAHSLRNILAFHIHYDFRTVEPGKLCLGVGIFVSFFGLGCRSFALKSCPGGGDFDRKISGPAVSPGGMVTDQIDTCITEVSRMLGVSKASVSNI